MERIVSEVDLSSCETTEEQARVIALCIEDGQARPKFIAEVLERCGVKVDNGYVSKVLRASPYWERVKHGVFRPKEFNAQEEVHHE